MWIRQLATALVILSILVGSATSAGAAPAPGLCTVDPARGTVSDDFALAACISTGSLVIHNDLSVPIELTTSGGVSRPSVAQIDQNPATLVARALINNSDVLLPGDLATYPLSSEAGSVWIKGTTGGETYVLAQTIGAFFPVGGLTKNLVDAATGLVSDVSEAVIKARDCRAGQNWLMQRACDLAFNATVVVVVVKAIAKGVLSGPLALILSTLEWAKLISNQVPSVEKVLKGERTVSILGSAPTPTPTESSASPPPPTSASPPASVWPTGDDEGPPALYAWLGASFYNMPRWVSCTSTHCIIDQGKTVLVVRLKGLVELGSIDSATTDPSGALAKLGVSSATASGLLKEGRSQ